MSAIWKCDGCGAEVQASLGHDGWMKPYSWYEKTVFEHEDAGFGKDHGKVVTILSACSRPCIERAALKAGTHSLVLPI